MKKIYFAGSIRGGRADRELYAEIIGLLRKYGVVLTEHIGDDALTSDGESGLTDREIHDRDLSWLANCDAVVAEVSVPSLGVGYEIARASAAGKPILCLYRPEEGKSLSAMISGCPGIRIAAYDSPGELPGILETFFSQRSSIHS